MARLKDSALARAIDFLAESFAQEPIVDPMWPPPQPPDVVKNALRSAAALEVCRRKLYHNELGAFTLTDLAAAGLGELLMEGSIQFIKAITPTVNQWGTGNLTEMYADPDTAQYVNKMAALVVTNDKISLGTRDTRGTQIYFGSIPTHQFSLCQPFLEITVRSDRDGRSVTGAVRTMSLVKFLQGANPVYPGNIDFDMVNFNPGFGASQVLSFVAGNARDPQGGAGMEIFTSPQTLVPAHEHGRTWHPRAAPIIDRMRPFLSIRDFTIDLYSANAGLLSFKTGRLRLILHDRARLAEIADLVNPNLFQRTEMTIEYGWNHPDGGGRGGNFSTNPYALLLNGSRKKEKYRVKNSRYSFTKEGEVEIDLELYLIGGDHFGTTHIVEDLIPNPAKEMRKLFEAIKVLVGNMLPQTSLQGSNTINAGEWKDVLNEQFFASMSDADSIPEIPQKVKDLVNTIKAAMEDSGRDLEAITSGAHVADLKIELDLLFGPPAGKGVDLQATGASNERSVQRAHKKTIANAILSKLNLMRKVPNKFAWAAALNPDLIQNIQTQAAYAASQIDREEPTADPFIPLTIPDQPVHPFDWHNSSLTGEQKHVSFGKIVMLFVAAPLASTGDFSEVQVVFYPFNKRAGAMGETENPATPAKNIATFPIDVEEFQSALTSAATKRRSPDMTVQEFIHYMAGNFIDDVTNEAYGLDLLPGTKRMGPDSKGNFKIKKAKGQKAKLSNKIDQALAEMGVADGIFNMPWLNVFLETYPARGPDTGPVKTLNPTSTILRIHIFDRAASPHRTAMSVIKSKAGKYRIIKKDTQAPDEPSNVWDLDLFTELVRRGRLTPFSGNQDVPGFLVKGPASNVKALIKSTMPSITYGTETSIIKNCSVSTMTNSELSTIFMLGSGGNGTPLAPTGAQASGIPLRAMPTRMSMTVMGCSMVEYGQQFFVDFGTGTTVDNIYTVIRVSHRITQGNFETDLDFIITDGYGEYESVANAVKVAANVITQGDT